MKQILRELRKIFVAALGAAIAAGILTFLEILGAQLKDAFEAGGMIAAARTALAFYHDSHTS